MVKKMLWFGNSERMTWVPCPKIEMGTATNHYVVETDFLNGGAAVRRSATGSRRYEMEWNLMDEGTLDTIESYWEGAWGPGPYYFLDPQAMKTNVFPAAWAQPRVALEDGPKLVFDTKPTRIVSSSYLAGSGLPGYRGPTTSAQYNVTSDSIPLELTIPVPQDYTLLALCDQSFSTGSRMSYSQDGGAWTPVLVTGIVGDTGGSLVKFRFEGTGLTTMLSMFGRIFAPNETVSLDNITFMSGKGNSGCEFTEYSKFTYSAALDKVGAAAVLREIGAWR